MEYMKLDINSIELDVDNPRIKNWLEIYKDEITSEQIALALSASAGSDLSSSYSVLKESIKVNKGIINPIIVNRKPDGTMTVIEGNTRLQIYKEFAERDPSGPWKEIIAIVYDNMPDEQIHAIRLQSHLVGPREWDPYSKAKYLFQLSEIDKLPMEMIISYCGGKKSEIRNYIEAYSDMQKYYVPVVHEAGMEIDPRDFSKFAELEKGDVRHSLNAHGYSITDFSKWVVNQNIDTAQSVRKLSKVMANPKARDQFFKTNISDAEKLLNADDKTSKILESASLSDLSKAVYLHLRKISVEELRKIKSDPSYIDEKNSIYDLYDELTNFLPFIEEES